MNKILFAGALALVFILCSSKDGTNNPLNDGAGNFDSLRALTATWNTYSYNFNFGKCLNSKSSSVIIAQTDSGLVRLVNSGADFKVVLPKTTGFEYIDFTMLNDTIFVLGNTASAAGDPVGIIKKSVDYGETWETDQVFTMNNGWTRGQFISSNGSVVMAAISRLNYNSGSGVFYYLYTRNVDGWVSSKAVDGSAQSVFVMALMNPIGSWLVLYTDAVFYVSKDNGNSWTEIKIQFGKYAITSITGIPELIIGSTNTMTGDSSIISFSGGLSWQNSFYCGSPIAYGKNIFIVNYNGDIVLTQNKGVSWHTIKINTDGEFNWPVIEISGDYLVRINKNTVQNVKISDLI